MILHYFSCLLIKIPNCVHISYDNKKELHDMTVMCVGLFVCWRGGGGEPHFQNDYSIV